VILVNNAYSLYVFRKYNGMFGMFLVHSTDQQYVSPDVQKELLQALFIGSHD